MTLKEWIKNRALLLGFHLAGITTPEPPPHYTAYEDWLAMGRHGQMTYLADERARRRRAEPRLLLPECKSILVLCTRYPHPGSGRFEDIEEKNAGSFDPRGRIAAYAWGQDYHDLLVQRMEVLVTNIKEHAGISFSHRTYTDTGPLLERELAQRAGLGWIGKNTCLITPRVGSFFFLSEILLGIELEPDLPFENDLCGTCERCIQSCPTACILPNRTLDSRRCISYLTIELRESIPIELRPLIGDRIFGCDDCQTACPWNRFAGEAYATAFSPSPPLPSPNLVKEIAISPEEFNDRFGKSAVRRAKRSGYRRNVAIALGNCPDRRALAVLGTANKDANPLLQEHVRWAIQHLLTENRAS